MYAVTSGHIAVVSTNITKRGVIAQLKEKMTYDPPWVLLQWPLREGEKWEENSLISMERDTELRKALRNNISSVVGGEETIHTPVGKFRTWRIEHTVGEDKKKFISWWAKGRWIVKWQSEGRENASVELVEFKELER